MRVLVVEDEVPLAKLIREGLISQGMLADVAISGEDALWMGASGSYDVICLDVNLPGIDGFETCRRLRAEGTATPILMLTARDAVEDRISGLDGGADDYLVKPFAFGELMARVRALTRRPQAAGDNTLTVGDLSLDTETLAVKRGDAPVQLSVKEVQILEVFMRNPDRVLSRTQILEGAWDANYEHRSNVIDVYVRYLREKIDRPFDRITLETVRGLGYRLRSN